MSMARNDTAILRGTVLALALGAAVWLSSTPSRSQPHTDELALTPEKRIAALEARVASLEARALRPVGAGYELSLNGAKISIGGGGDVTVSTPRNLTLKSGAATHVASGSSMTILSRTNLSANAARDATLTAGSGLRLKSAQGTRVESARSVDLVSGLDSTLEAARQVVIRAQGDVFIKGQRIQ